MVLPIAEDVHDYAKSVYQALLAAGIRAELDTRSEKIGKKIRDAEVSKIPCMIVIGQKEQESGEVSLRRHRIGDEGRFSVSGLIEKLKTEITGKS
jgi:threonyl-tRNA synthetase